MPTVEPYRAMALNISQLYNRYLLVECNNAYARCRAIACYGSQYIAIV